MADARVDRWLAALIDRHTADMSRSELLKAVRALSVRYVERRASLTGRQPVDSPGKRAAFAAFYAPLHFFTARAVLHSLSLDRACPARLIDLGCGTGIVSAAWALSCEASPMILGIDRQDWALREAAWNWRTLGLRGQGRRGDLVRAAESLAGDRRPSESTALVFGWSVNELDEVARGRLLDALERLAARGIPSLVIEPIARRVAPWWEEWAQVAVALGGQVTEGRFDVPLPAALAALDEAAGFRREGLAARALWFGAIPSKS